MREIKFRAWDNVNKAMAYNVHRLDSFNEFLSKKKWTPMQFTGLLDKNGKEIYEGDIIEWMSGRIGVIEWQQQNACFYISWKIGERYFYCEIKELAMSCGEMGYILDDIEIIGNIYETPNLIPCPSSKP